MSMIYSHYTGDYIDTDRHEVVELNDGDVIRADNDTALREAYQNGKISAEQMKEIGFEEEDLKGRA